MTPTEYILYKGDCLDIMQKIRGESIQMILCDLPYGTTARNEWDKKIPLEPLWDEWLRILKPNGVIALWSQMPFTAELIMSRPQLFRYEWIIEKTHATGFLNAKKMPLKCHEQILVFYKKLPLYNPQKTTGHSPTHYAKRTVEVSNRNEIYNKMNKEIISGGATDRYPRDVLRFKWDTQKSSLHPTQKPVECLEYFIKTYTNEGDVVLDNTMGSGSTIIASINTKRKYIGFEQNVDYFKIAKERIDEQLKNI